MAPIDFVATYGALEMEYAAIRKHCGLIDLPTRGVVEVTGRDRIDFLNRMLSQELRPGKRDIDAYSVVPAFLVSRKGRVEADLVVVVLRDRVLLEVDALNAARAAGTLSSYVVMEECAVADLSTALHRLSLHGPTALSVLERVFVSAAGAPELAAVVAGQATEGVVGGHSVVIFRSDDCGVPGWHLITPVDGAVVVMQQLIGAGHDAGHVGRHESVQEGIALPVLTGRSAGAGLAPIGWLAFNIARIESGTPLFNIDFGGESLPAETGVLESRVSFTKGCYPGQEVVARMHARKQVKQRLVAVKFEGVRGASAAGDQASIDGETPYALLPEQGAPLLVAGPTGSVVVGRVTSSTLSPMHAMAPVALAQVRAGSDAPGTVVHTDIEGSPIRGTLQGGLSFGQPQRTGA